MCILDLWSFSALQAIENSCLIFFFKWKIAPSKSGTALNNSLFFFTPVQKELNSMSIDQSNARYIYITLRLVMCRLSNF